MSLYTFHDVHLGFNSCIIVKLIFVSLILFVIICLETSFRKCTCQSTVKINCENTIQEFHHVLMMQLIDITIQFCHQI